MAAELRAMPPLVERARAKVNLTLRVLGRRADGYHELDSLVGFAEVHDVVQLTSGPLGLEVSGPWADALGTGDDNLVLRAARGFAEAFPDAALGHFTLVKHLPIASGLGGGSADAAAALRLLARLNGLPLDSPELFALAGRIGADVPVCLRGDACRMRGIGERLGPRLGMPSVHVVLVNPCVAVETAAVFRALGLPLGEIGQPATQGDHDLRAEILHGGNDLQAAAMRAVPEIGAVLESFEAQAGCLAARMSGSGATCFGLFERGDTAEAAAAHISADQPGWWVRATSLA
jgi:4-diphosphocytidyl-2-C-methyl-D-erythritol kinase